MLTFFCTRCGTRLQASTELAGGAVRCGHCRGTTRTPEAADHVPFARVAEPATPEDFTGEAEAVASVPVAGLAVPLPYATSPPDLGRWERSLALDVLADRLEHVQAPDENEGEGLNQCPHCGSSIAYFVRKCPFCRHPLFGP